MTPELEQQIKEQAPLFGALITTPEGVTFCRDELGGVPVEITEPAGGAGRRRGRGGSGRRRTARR